MPLSAEDDLLNAIAVGLPPRALDLLRGSTLGACRRREQLERLAVRLVEAQRLGAAWLLTGPNVGGTADVSTYQICATVSRHVGDVHDEVSGAIDIGQIKRASERGNGTAE